MADIGASILSKLKNKSKSSGLSYQLCLQLYFQEEFLRRLSKSRYAGNFVLKGGLFIYTLTEFSSRATVDIDFLLQKLSNDLEHLDEVIAEIIETPTGYNDTIILTAKASQPISMHRRYPGASTQIIGRINNVKVPFDVDIGVGDIIIPRAEKRSIQTQLDGYESPEVYTYSLESTIAEKFDAILQRMELSGRMKDFFDIYYVAHTFDFDGQNLQMAIIQTLHNRGTTYDQESFDRVAALAEDAAMQTKWRYFLRTIKGQDIQFSEVMQGIDAFLRPVFKSVVDGADFSKCWSSRNGKWQ